MLEILQPHKVKLTDDKTLSQKNRPIDEKPGVKLFFEGTFPNTLLDEFDPAIRRMAYEPAKAAKGQVQQQLDGVPEVSPTPHLTQAGLKVRRFSWDYDFTGYKVTVVRGLGGAPSNIPLADAIVRWRTIAFEEGGTVFGKLVVEAGNVDGTTRGRLAELKSRECEITLEAPEVTQQDIERDAIPPAPQRKPGAAERAAAAKAGKDTGPKTPHKDAKAPPTALSSEAAWPFPKGDKGTDKPPQRTTVENVKPARTARGAAKTKEALNAKYHDHQTGSTWSGRGPQPAWLKAALANGKKLSDFEVRAS